MQKAAQSRAPDVVLVEGDTIRAGNYAGTVRALELFSTVLVTS